jgi:homoserine dehydrogenase
MEPVKVGLLGLGIVGGGTISVLRRNATEIARRAGRGIIVTHASARDLKKPREFPLDGIELLGDPLELVNHPEVEIVAELIGGTELAREVVMQAISNGKHVVTANKALIAIHGNEIFEAATRKGVIVAFEAAVAGGIPIIKAIREGLAGNSISSVAGIINGTTNFILTAMREQVRSFEDVLAEAQSLGYAEANPTFDVEGIDAAHKLTILAAIAFGIPLQFEKVYTEGITQITIDDIGFAERFGYRIRHLGIARRTSEGVELRVHPTLIPERRLIANVDGVRNAVLVIGDAVGPTIYYGAGAGADPTASAVVADLVDIVRAFTTDPGNRVPHLAFQSDALSYEEILPMEEISTAYYLRMQALDRPGVLADVTRILGESGISIEAILQREPVEGASFVPIIILTQSVREKYMNQAIEKLEALPNINGRIMRIRMDPLS